jgi:hypothetical protein
VRLRPKSFGDLLDQPSYSPRLEHREPVGQLHGGQEHTRKQGDEEGSFSLACGDVPDCRSDCGGREGLKEFLNGRGRVREVFGLKSYFWIYANKNWGKPASQSVLLIIRPIFGSTIMVLKKNSKFWKGKKNIQKNVKNLM